MKLTGCVDRWQMKLPQVSLRFVFPNSLKRMLGQSVQVEQNCLLLNLSQLTQPPSPQKET
jgi:hypothetical protein